jgi:hypothetical protein
MMSNEEVMQRKVDLAIKTLNGFGFEFTPTTTLAGMYAKVKYPQYFVTQNGEYVCVLTSEGVIEMAKRELANRLMCFDFNHESESIKKIGETMSAKLMTLIKNGTIDEDVSIILLEAGIRLNESVDLIMEASKKYHGVSEDEYESIY